MGELFNSGLLTEMTIHTCLFKLIPSIEQVGMVPDEGMLTGNDDNLIR